MRIAHLCLRFLICVICNHSHYWRLLVVHEERLDGLDDDGKVKDKRAILHVVYVIRQLFYNIGCGLVFLMIDLCPTGYAGLDDETDGVVRDLGDQFLNDLGSFRPRADERQIAANDVPELRQFIQVGRAEEAADRRYAQVTLSRPLRTVRFCGSIRGERSHRSEFVERKGRAVFSCTGLGVNDRSERCCRDEQCNEGFKRKKNDPQRDRRDNLQTALEVVKESALADAVLNEPRLADPAERNFAEHGLIESRNIPHRDARGKHLIEQFCSMRVVPEMGRDDYERNAITSYQAVEVGERLAGISLHDDGVPDLRIFGERVAKFTRERAGVKEQDAVQALAETC